MLLPSSAHAIRQLVEAVYSRGRLRPRVVAEIESFETLAAAVAEGLGVTVLPRPLAAALATTHRLGLRQFGSPATVITLSLSTADGTAASEAAQVIHRLVADLAAASGGEPHPR